MKGYFYDATAIRTVIKYCFKEEVEFVKEDDQPELGNELEIITLDDEVRFNKYISFKERDDIVSQLSRLTNHQ